MRGRRLAVAAVIGCVLALILVLLDFLSGGSDLRTGIVPVAAGLLAASGAFAILAARSRGVGIPPRWASVIGFVTALGLLAIATFFFGLAGLSLMGSDLLDADTPLASAGTAVASVLTFFIVPVGIVLYGLAVFQDDNMPLALRLDLWMSTAALIAGGALLNALPEQAELWAQSAWLALLAAAILHFSAGILKAPSGRGETEPALGN
jgi:hypothetical protein